MFNLRLISKELKGQDAILRYKRVLCRAANRMVVFPDTGSDPLMLKRQFSTIVVAPNDALSTIAQTAWIILHYSKGPMVLRRCVVPEGLFTQYYIRSS